MLVTGEPHYDGWRDWFFSSSYTSSSSPSSPFFCMWVFLGVCDICVCVICVCACFHVCRCTCTCVHMPVEAWGNHPPLLLHWIHWALEAGSLGQTKSQMIWLVSLASSLWRYLLSAFWSWSDKQAKTHLVFRSVLGIWIPVLTCVGQIL